ncbi:HupE/UreJ family protein [Cyanobium sp. FGCU-52]|nr:HupE/UreJ family protein [Cyanobium sp. FGCU52]
MAPTSPRSLALTAAAGFGLSLLSALPAGAHGFSGEGLTAGLAHPLTGLDHLLLLVGAGGAAAAIDSTLLGFALGGAVLGAAFGAFGGTLPAAELLAALAISAMGLLMLRRGPAAQLAPAGALVAAAVAVHAMLHGQEAPGQALWWLGAALGSGGVLLGSFALLRRLGDAWTGRLALALCLAGGVLALMPSA